MPRTSPHPKVENFNFRVDPGLKSAFTAAAARDDRPAGQILREFMRGYVEQREAALLRDEARRQSALVSATDDEAEALAWIEDVSAPGDPT